MSEFTLTIDGYAVLTKSFEDDINLADELVVAARPLAKPAQVDQARSRGAHRAAGLGRGARGRG